MNHMYYMTCTPINKKNTYTDLLSGNLVQASFGDFSSDCLRLASAAPSPPLHLCLHPAGTDVISDTVRRAGEWEPDLTMMMALALGRNK